MSKLAIVIPAYKRAYFADTLDCFARQTNKDFHIYIGDDHSNDNLEELILPYREQLPITYYRFESNIGSKHIVDQWERSISLIKNEEWIWLFSDDDLVDANGVEAFWNIVSLTHGSKDIYSFNTCVINKVGDVISKAPEVPPFETSEEMAYHLLIGKRANCMPDHIFSRAVYQKNKGFVKTVYGQGADWANSILFSSDNGSCIIPDALVYWRFSGDNISFIAFQHKAEMIVGHFQFIQWILNHFNYLKEKKPGDYTKIKNAALQNLLSVIDYHYKGVPLSRLFYFAWFIKKYFNLPMIRVISLVTKMNTYSMGRIKMRKQKQ
jgi:glycosyltransferase involved in cell wall biosynthesis